MKLDLTTAIIHPSGEQIFEGKSGEEKGVTIKELLMTSLRAGGQDEKDEEKKYGRFNLLFTLKDLDKEIDLKPEQIVDLKELAHKTYNDPWIYGQIRRVLDK